MCLAASWEMSLLKGSEASVSSGVEEDSSVGTSSGQVGCFCENATLGAGEPTSNFFLALPPVHIFQFENFETEQTGAEPKMPSWVRRNLSQQPWGGFLVSLRSSNRFGL